MALRLLALLPPILWAAAVTLAAWSAGRPLYRWLTRDGARPEGAALEAVLSFLLGIALLGNLAFALATLGALHAWLLVGLTVALALTGAVQLARRPGFRASWSFAPLLLALLVVVAHLPAALYPVLAHDDNVFHLLAPRLYLEHHAFVRDPLNLFMNGPHLVEMLYSFPMASGDFTAAKVFAWSFAFWTIAGIVAFVRPRAGTAAAGILALVYILGPNVRWHLGSCHVEPILGMCFLGAILALVAWRETGNRGYLWVLGVACGMACATKYVAWIFGAVMLAIGAFEVLRSPQPWRARASQLALLAAIPACFLAGWLVKSALWTGNPVYPNFFSLLDGAHWSEIQAMHLHRSQAAAGGIKTWWSYLLLPYRLVVEPPPNPFYSANFSGSLMLLLIASFFVRSSYRPPWGSLRLAAVGGFCAWACLFQQGRWLVAWVPVMAVAASAALVPLSRSRGALTALTLLVIGIGAVQTYAQPDPGPLPVNDVLFKSRSELLARNVNYTLCQELNARLPRNAKVLGIFDNRLYFLDRPFSADAAYEAPSVLAWLRERDDADVFARDLVAAGFTHVVFRPEGAEFYFENKMPFDLRDDRLYSADRLWRDAVLFNAFLNHHVELLWTDRECIVGRLHASRSGAADGTSTRDPGYHPRR